eukprot:9487079-Pyramimonas_sp.AAC.1
MPALKEVHVQSWLEAAVDRLCTLRVAMRLRQDLAGSCPGYFSPGDPQEPPRACEIETRLRCYWRS